MDPAAIAKDLKDYQFYLGDVRILTSGKGLDVISSSVTLFSSGKYQPHEVDRLKEVAGRQFGHYENVESVFSAESWVKGRVGGFGGTRFVESIVVHKHAESKLSIDDCLKMVGQNPERQKYVVLRKPGNATYQKIDDCNYFPQGEDVLIILNAPQHGVGTGEVRISTGLSEIFATEHRKLPAVKYESRVKQPGQKAPLWKVGEGNTPSRVKPLNETEQYGHMLIPVLARQQIIVDIGSQHFVHNITPEREEEDLYGKIRHALANGVSHNPPNSTDIKFQRTTTFFITYDPKTRLEEIAVTGPKGALKGSFDVLIPLAWEEELRQTGA